MDNWVGQLNVGFYLPLILAMWYICGNIFINKFQYIMVTGSSSTFNDAQTFLNVNDIFFHPPKNKDEKLRSCHHSFHLWNILLLKLWDYLRDGLQ